MSLIDTLTSHHQDTSWLPGLSFPIATLDYVFLTAGLGVLCFVLRDLGGEYFTTARQRLRADLLFVGRDAIRRVSKQFWGRGAIFLPAAEGAGSVTLAEVGVQSEKDMLGRMA